MARQTPTVTCVGIAVRDTVFSVDHPLEPGAKNLATSVRTRSGGPAANAAVTIAALGGTARLISTLGTDGVGDSIARDLAERGVDVSRLRRLDGVGSGASSVVVDPVGERTIVNCTDGRLIDSTHPVTSGEVEGSDAIVVDLRWPDGARSAIEAARALSVASIVDFDLTTTRRSDDIVGSASHVIFSRPALAKFSGMTDVDGALLAVAATTEAFVAVTLGGQGVRWVEGGQVRTLPGFRVDVVDTLGAGDVFHGAFAFAVALGWSVREAMRFASAAAAITCSRAEGGDRLPTRAEVDELLETNP